MRVLVIGGSGLVGQAATRALQAAGHDVFVADLRPLPDDFSKVPWLPTDIRGRHRVRIAMNTAKPDAVILLAARHFIPLCNRYPAATLQVNVVGTQHVIDAMRAEDVEYLVFTSSAAVYGAASSPLSEEAPLAPDDIYGWSKVFGEKLLELACAESKVRCCVLRLFNVYGPGDSNPHLIPRIVSQLQPGHGLRLGNLESIRDYVYVEDTADAIVRAIERAPKGLTVCNVGTGEGHSVRETVTMIEGLVGRSIAVESTDRLRRAVDRPVLVANPSRARRMLGWRSQTRFEDGLARTLQAVGLGPSL
jgi:UDP-glucose 4-epimerase